MENETLESFVLLLLAMADQLVLLRLRRSEKISRARLLALSPKMVDRGHQQKVMLSEALEGRQKTRLNLMKVMAGACCVAQKRRKEVVEDQEVLVRTLVYLRCVEHGLWRHTTEESGWTAGTTKRPTPRVVYRCWRLSVTIRILRWMLLKMVRKLWV